MSTLMAEPRETAGREQRLRVEDLLSRYPEVSAGEAEEILQFLKKGPSLQVGLITAKEHLKENLRRFRTDRAADLGLGWKEYLTIAIAMSALIAICILLWDAGVR